MSTVQDVYNEVSADLLEPYDSGQGPGLSLGIVTFQQFIDLLNGVLVDFMQRTSLVKLIQTQMIFAGQGQYAVPDNLLKPEMAFLAGRFLEHTTVEELYNHASDWRTNLTIPEAWHEDGLPIKTVELANTPNYTGAQVNGPNAPAPPFAQTGTFSILDSGNNVVQPIVHRDLSIIGAQEPTAVAVVGDTIPLIPDEWALGYLPFGVLYRIFSGDNELRDPERADWYRSQYEEGIMLAALIGRSLEME